MQKQKKANKQQNKGFTLVELLIAITILGIIVVPLLHSFVTAARTNAKAKQVLKSTTLAQNVMEEVKSYSLEEVARQFDKNGYASDTNLVSLAKGGFFEAIETVDGYEAVITESESLDGALTVNSSVRGKVDPTTNSKGVFVGQASGEYHFMMQQVEIDESKFDMAIHLSENESKDLVSIKGMNRTDCGYYAQLAMMDTNVAEDFATKNENYDEAIADLTTSQIEERMERTISIAIDEDNGNQKVEVEYSYDIGEGYTWPEDRYYSEYATIFDNYSSGEELKAVYLYYYPLYGTSRTDTIVIQNNDYLDIDVYLIRMVNEEYNEYDDADYHPQIQVVEAGSDESQSYLKVCHNIQSPVFTYNIALSGDRVQKATLGNKETKECLYDVTIEVFKYNKDNPFEEENLINTFTGSLLDNSDKN